MGKSEPTFIPEWLKGCGGGTISPSLHSDDHMVTRTLRNKSSAGINDKRIGSSFVLDRGTSSYFRRSSSSNGSSHSRSHDSFGRSNWDRGEKEKIDTREQEKHFLGDHIRECSDPFGNLLPCRFKKDLRCSQSMMTGKQHETLPRKMLYNLSNTNKSSGLQTGVSALSNVHKASLQRDFPSLGAEERQASEIRRVFSPGLSSAIPNMSLGTSALTRGDTWTSALAEVPALAASNKIGSVQQVNTPVSVSMASSMMTGLSMAEIVAKGPSRALTPPQLSGGTQKLEELAIKQSKQLIPVTPSMPKALVLNSSEKHKGKFGQQQISSPFSSSHSPRSAPVTPDLLKLSRIGKLHILKPAREGNGAVPSSKDSLSPTSVSKVVANTPVAVGSALSKGPLEKKLTPQARSRNDFFNLMRKKSVASPSSSPTGPGLVSFNSDDSGSANSPLISHNEDSSVLGSFFGDETSKGSDDKCNEIFSERRMGSSFGEGESPLLGSSFGDGSSKRSNDKCKEIFSESPMEFPKDKVFGSYLNGLDYSCSNGILSSEKEEVAFLRSLGWEENGEEDEGLTEEEISSFFKDVDEYIKSRLPSEILQAMQPKVLESLILRIGSIGGGASFISNSSDSKSES